MSSWWTVIEGSGLQNCPPNLVKKLNGLSWITQAAWKSEPNGFHLALECVFETTEAVKTKKRLQKELNPKQGTIGKQLPDAQLKVIKLGTAGERFANFYCDFVSIKTISEAIECVPDAAPNKVSPEDWAMLGLPPGASPDAITKAYKEQALIWHPDKPTGDLRHFQALQQAYKRLAGIPDPEDEIRTMTVEPKISERINEAMVQARKSNADAPQDEKWDKIAEDLAKHLTLEEAQEGCRLMQEYKKELDKATDKAKNWSCIFYRATEVHARLQKREKAKNIAEHFKESAKYWPPGVLMNEWFQPTNWQKSSRQGNEDLDPYVIFDKFTIMKVMPRPVPMGKSVEVRVGRDLKDAVDYGEKLTLPMELFWNKHYRERFDYLGFDMEVADGMHCHDRFTYLFHAGLGPNPAYGMSLNVCAASALYHNTFRAAQGKKYQKHSDEAWLEHDRRSMRARAERDAFQIEDQTFDQTASSSGSVGMDLAPRGNKRPREVTDSESDNEIPLEAMSWRDLPIDD